MKVYLFPKSGPNRSRIHSSFHKLRFAAAALTLSSIASCRDRGVVDAPLPRAELTWFTPVIAAQIDKNGQLPGIRPGGVGESEISATRAVELAAMTHRQFGNAMQPFWSHDAGYSVRAADLHPCSRVDFIDHPYVVIPAQASAYFKSRVGPQWLVRYCANSSVTAVEYYVSAQGLSTDLDSLGQFRSNSPLTAISSRAINRAIPARESSEDAASVVFSRSRRQIADLPTMLRVSGDVSPWVISWSLKQIGASVSTAATTQAYPFGNPRKWSFRDSSATTVEADTLLDNSVTPAQTYILRRRPNAVTRADVRQILGQ